MAQLVELTDAQVAQCRLTATQRTSAARRAGRRHIEIVIPPARADVIGVAGEIAFAQVCGLALTDWGGPDPGYDFDVPGFGTIDVKTAARPIPGGASIILDLRRRFDADFCVSAEMDGPRRVTLIGWIDRHSFFQESDLLPQRGGDARILRGPRLGRIENFIDRVLRGDPPYRHIDPCDLRPWPRSCP